MKKSISSALCSALIVPGLGQVMNRKIMKGLILMGLVFVIIVAAAMKLALLIMAQIKTGDLEGLNNLLENKLPAGSLSSIWIMIIILIILWLYAIVDAYIDGLRIEKEGNEEGQR